MKLLVRIIIKMVRGMLNTLTSTQMVALGFLCVILVGAFVLTTPAATRDGISTPFIDALFTATSATCVTGLVVVDTFTYWSALGQVVIMLLIQIGGLGFMTIATLISFAVGRKITLRERLLMVESYNQPEIQGIVVLTKRVILLTLGMEAIAALIMSISLIPEYGLGMGLYKSMFMAVSSFCNAGFDVFGDRGAFTSYTTFFNNYILMYTTMALIVVGGLGFNVWMDIIRYRKLGRLRIHTKIALITTGALIVIGAVIIGGSEWGNVTMNHMTVFEKVTNALFHSVTPRTAGINSLSTADMTSVSKFTTILLMFIGGSPGSTAGGIKTVTFAVITLGMLSVVRGSRDINVFKKRISIGTFFNAVAITMIATAVLFAAVILLSAFETFDFLDLLYEAVSAFGTVGLSLGITSGLRSVSKFILICLMFFGRVGVLTMAFALLAKLKKDSPAIRYPEAKVMVG